MPAHAQKLKSVVLSFDNSRVFYMVYIPESSHLIRVLPFSRQFLVKSCQFNLPYLHLASSLGVSTNFNKLSGITNPENLDFHDPTCSYFSTTTCDGQRDRRNMTTAYTTTLAQRCSVIMPSAHFVFIHLPLVQYGSIKIVANIRNQLISTTITLTLTRTA